MGLASVRMLAGEGGCVMDTLFSILGAIFLILLIWGGAYGLAVIVMCIFGYDEDSNAA